MFRTNVQNRSFDVAILGGGLAGMATALRLQAAGRSTIVLEAHGHAGGCAGYFRHRGFSFDVGATTLVDFEPGGVGGEFIDAVGLGGFDGECLPGYVAWMPDRVVTLYRDQEWWRRERLSAFGESPAHQQFWALLDRLAEVFWAASRAGITLPLGVTIRGAGLTRHRGGMHGFWKRMVARYRELGGVFQAGCRVDRVEPGFAARTGRVERGFTVHTGRGVVMAERVVSSLPVSLTAQVCPMTTEPLRRYLRRDEPELGGAVVVFLGVPESEVAGQDFTHHQLMHSYPEPLGEGNNMFVSVSSPGDLDSAPAGYRAVMISTHTELGGWDGPDYEQRKKEIGERLIRYAQRVYPNLGERAVVYQVGTPRSYERFTSRPGGAVGGVRQTLRNTNQFAVPHDIGVKGLWLAGDTTWPGLGTVACILGSRIVAQKVLRS